MATRKPSSPPNSSAPQATQEPRRAATQGTASPVRHAAAATAELAYVQVASSELTRDLNRDLVLGRIRALQPVSRIALSRSTGLQPSTVSSLVEQLLAEGWIREGAQLKTARGRRPAVLSLNDDLLILTADLRPGYAVVALMDLQGRFLLRQLVPLGSDPEAGLARIAGVMQGFRDAYPDKTVEGVGISLPGRVDAATGQLVLSPNLGWANVDLRKTLADRLQLKVELENAAVACLLAELWFGHMDGIRNAVLITISEGVGTALLAEGRLLSGWRGLAGEFGHVCIEPDGLLCGCGARGCWEMYASSRAALRTYRELNPAGDCPTIVRLVSLASDGDPSALQALERQAEAIGRGLHVLDAVLSPELILFAGDMTVVWDMSRETIAREAAAGALHGPPPPMRSVGDGELARLRGAAAVVLQRHSGYYRASHPRRP